MSHMIDKTTGQAGIAYRGELPWHGLGQPMKEGEPLDAWRVRAGLNWEAIKSPVLFHTDADIATVDNKCVLYRSDTRAPLSVMGSDYQIVQPAAVLDFYRDLTERHGYKMETAGSLFDGKRIWALARVDDEIRISGNDIINPYLLLSTSFDGTSATRADFTTVRVVCNNTLSAAVTGKKANVSIPHSTMFNADAAKVKLGVGDFATFAQEAQAMAETKVSTKQAIEFFLSVYHDLTVKEVASNPEDLQRKTDRTIERLSRLFIAGPGSDLRSANGTAWGLLNAVTRDVDFSERSRSADARLASAWYGPGSDLKEKARDLALAIAA